MKIEKKKYLLYKSALAVYLSIPVEKIYTEDRHTSRANGIMGLIIIIARHMLILYDKYRQMRQLAKPMYLWLFSVHVRIRESTLRFIIESNQWKMNSVFNDNKHLTSLGLLTRDDAALS